MEGMGGCLRCLLVPLFNLTLTICGFNDNSKVTWFDKPVNIRIRTSTVPVKCQIFIH
jgi:hypothetical protein